MNKLFATLIAATFLVAAVPASASTAEKNLTFFADMIGENYDPNAVVYFPYTGEEMTMAKALDIAVERAGDVDLAALTAGLAPGDASGVGDIWILESGSGGCGIDAQATPVPSTALDPQLWTYAGGAGTQVTEHGSYTTIMDWTSKSLGGTAFNSAGFTFVGQSDFYCFEFFGTHFAFTFNDGVATTN